MRTSWFHRSLRMGVVSLVVFVLVALVGDSVSAQPEQGDGVSRLFVADAATHVVSVFDPESRQRVASFGTPGKIGNVYPSSTGRWVFVVHTDANRVTVLDSGLRLVDHADHDDLEIGPPYVRGTLVPGRKPIDFWAGHGMATIHNDDDGTLSIFDERGLEDDIAARTIKGAGAGHNNAVVLDDTVLLSLASEGVVTAYGLADGAPRSRFEGCPRTHGWTAPTSTFAAVGCLDGIMTFTKDGGTVQARKIAPPDPSAENVRVSTITSHRNSPILVSNFGTGMAVVHQDAPVLTPVVLSAAPVRFAYDRDGLRVIVLTADGKLHALDPTTGVLVWSVDAVSPVDPTGAIPRPSLTVGEAVAYVSDPPRGTIARIDLSSGSPAGAPIQAGGTPTLLTVITMEGVGH